MASETQIGNMSLSNLGVGKEVANLRTEKSAEAAALRRYYDVARQATLRDFPLPFSRKTATLNLIATNPNSEWGYSYRYPVDCIEVRKILSGNPYEDRQSRIVYQVGKDSQGKIILTNQAAAEIEYTEDVKDPSFYPADFTIAFSFRLSSLIAPRVTQGDPFKLKNDMLGQYELEIGRTRRNGLNEQQDAEEPESELIRSRG